MITLRWTLSLKDILLPWNQILDGTNEFTWDEYRRFITTRDSSKFIFIMFLPTHDTDPGNDDPGAFRP